MPTTAQTGNERMSKENNLIWIDLEMTGLNVSTDRIIEIATVVTDSDLSVLATGPLLVIHQPESSLVAMDEWNTLHHGRSGLTEEVRTSDCDEARAERETLEFLAQHVAPGVSPMCGNSICQDRRFLATWMPSLERFFHYRNLDVSTIKELVRRWFTEEAQEVKKVSAHRALADIHESIQELEHYRRTVFTAGGAG